MKRKPMQVVIGGVAALVVAMGIGRFAYTPILPLMENAKMLTEAGSGFLASINYLGYLVGALLASLLRWQRGRQFYLFLYVIISVATTILMGFTEVPLFWYGLRLLSGIASGLIFVFATSIVVDTLTYYRKVTWTGIFYSGVGLGIFISGLLVPLFARNYGWQGAWIGTGFFALIAAMVVFTLVRERPEDELGRVGSDVENSSKANQKTFAKPHLKYLLIAYGCEGIGYIISATFLVALVQRIDALSEIPSVSWIIVGLAAIPSGYLWSLIASHLGNLKSLQLAFALQIVGVILPAVFFNAAGALLGSLLFGVTFMGITTLFMAEVRRSVQVNSSVIIGYFTFVYGLGQMLGPAVAGILIDRTASYNSSLYFAATTLVIGMVFIGITQRNIQEEKGVEL